MLKEIERIIRDNHIKWYNIKDVSKITNLSQSTIRRAISKGELKVSKKTGKLLFKLTWIESFLNG